MTVVIVKEPFTIVKYPSSCPTVRRQTRAGFIYELPGYVFDLKMGEATYHIVWDPCAVTWLDESRVQIASNW